MGNNEIKLREQLSTGHIHRHRNYDDLLKQHRRARRFSQTLRFFMYSVIVTIIVLLLVALSFYVIQLKKKQEERKTEPIRTSMRI